MSSEMNLFGGQSTSQGQRVSGAVARQIRRETEAISARAEVAAFAEQANAFAVSVAMTNVSVLVSQAETLLRATPAAAPFLETLVSGYAMGAAQRLGRGV
ncbi:hypothetical protein [Leucobacter aridicollis]|uniref:hypothetical protein n=1 Tax=Leucobacter aridicollis TaxID=283878 RepID=UPI00216759C0|nr:hypothetical protein [Leucobacter aridicollis]MCS3427105.1 hypothetical protein [Leucobacter aridicollis]